MSIVELEHPNIRFEVKHRGRWRSIGKVMSVQCRCDRTVIARPPDLPPQWGVAVTTVEVEFLRTNTRYPIHDLVQPWTIWDVKITTDDARTTVKQARHLECSITYDFELKEKWLFKSSEQPNVVWLTNEKARR